MRLGIHGVHSSFFISQCYRKMAYANWNPTAYYLPGDIVIYNSVEYQALLSNFNVVPSTLAPNWVLLNPPAPAVVDSLNGLTGNIVAVAGSGIGVTPGVPTAQDITIDNTGVLSLDGATGALTTKQGFYYLNAPQNLTSPNTTVVFTDATSWTDNTAITWTGPSASFTVAQKGIYQLEFNVTVNANGAAYTTTSNKSAIIDITRAPAASQAIFLQSALMATAANYAQCVSATIELEVGDVIGCRVANTFTGGPPNIVQFAAPIDYATVFTWTLIRTLP